MGSAGIQLGPAEAQPQAPGLRGSPGRGCGLAGGPPTFIKTGRGPTPGGRRNLSPPPPSSVCLLCGGCWLHLCTGIPAWVTPGGVGGVSVPSSACSLQMKELNWHEDPLKAIMIGVEGPRDGGGGTHGGPGPPDLREQTAPGSLLTGTQADKKEQRRVGWQPRAMGKALREPTGGLRVGLSPG